MNTNFTWIDEDCTLLMKYNFTKGTLLEINDFFQAKKAFLLSPDAETKATMKYHFLNAHSSLKSECSCHKISPAKLEELTEILRKGVL